MDERHAAVRVGDRERREVETRLQQACVDGVLTMTEYDDRAARCWDARTRGDLEVLTRDLPDTGSGPGREPVPDPRPVVPAPSHVPHRRRRIAAVAAAAVVGAALVLAPVLTADDGMALFGSRQVEVAPDQDRIEVGVLFGSVQVVVPDTARVRTEGGVLFGSQNCDGACDGSGERDVVVVGTGGFGSIEVVRPDGPD